MTAKSSPTRHRGRARERPSSRSWFAAALVLLVLVTLGLTVAPQRASAGASVEVFKSGLAWPTALAFAPDGRIFYAERLSGQIRVIKDGALLPTPFYTLTNTPTVGEQGLLGLALDPAFGTDSFVYAYHTFDDAANGTTYNRIVRILANGDVGGAFEVVLDRIPAGTVHNGGVISFAPDGTLFAVVGEGGVPANSQDLTSLAGKVLRMNKDGTVPANNPFAGNPNANPYLYTFGHRNMFGIAWHPTTGRIFLSENGPQCNDELNLLQAGRNFGWGPNWSCGNPSTIEDTNRDGPSPVLPIQSWTPVIAPTNLVAYSGPAFARWRGDIFIGDFNTHSLRRIDLATPNYDVVLGQEIVATVESAVLDVEVGPDGAIWFTTPSTIYRLVDTSIPPTAAFTYDPAAPMVGQPVTFDASSSSDPDTPIVSYSWDFGDGLSGAGVGPTHSYSTHGTITVTLTIVDADGLSDAAEATFRVRAPPAASFTFDPPNPLLNEAISFDASGSSDPDGSIVRYDWVWDDGSTSAGLTEPIATHAYSEYGTYRVVLTVRDNDGLMGNASVSVRIGTSPTAEFTFDPALPQPGEIVLFDGSGSSDPDGSIVSYDWEFGDGGTASGVTATHAYTASGTYTVVLRVVDNASLPDSTNATIRVNGPPTILAASPDGLVRLALGSSVRLSVNSSDPDGDPITFAWAVDGVPQTASAREFLFRGDRAGTFSVNVTVRDGVLEAYHEWTVIVDSAPDVLSLVLWPAIATGFIVAGGASFLVWRTRAKAKGRP